MRFFLDCRTPRLDVKTAPIVKELCDDSPSPDALTIRQGDTVFYYPASVNGAPKFKPVEQKVVQVLTAAEMQRRRPEHGPYRFPVLEILGYRQLWCASAWMLQPLCDRIYAGLPTMEQYEKTKY